MALQNLRSGTAHKRPTASSMSDGQIALNTNATDTGLFFKDASGNLVKAGPVSVGTSAPNSSAAGSSGNSVGEIWLDTTSSNYIIKIWDGTAWRFDAGLAYLAGLSFTNESEFKAAVNLETGVDVQAYDAGLNYLAGLTFTTESTFKQAVNLEIGVDVQGYDADTTKNDVANTFTAAQTFNAGASDADGDLRSVPQNAKTSAYTLVAGDAGKHISITTGGVTVPASVFSVGDAISIYNNSSSTQTITQGSSVTLRLGGDGASGNKTLDGYGLVTVLCVASNVFVIAGAGVS